MPYLEVIQNGAAVQVVRLSDWAESGGRLPPVAFRESGWLLVRAVTEADDRYQLASSAPSFVESVSGPRVSAEAVRFFLDWLAEARERFADQDAAAFDTADAYWRKRHDSANAVRP